MWKHGNGKGESMSEDEIRYEACNRTAVNVNSCSRTRKRRGQQDVTVVLSEFRVKGVATVRISPFGFRYPMPLTLESALSFVRLEFLVSVHNTYVLITADCNQTVSNFYYYNALLLLSHCYLLYNLYVIHESQISQ